MKKFLIAPALLTLCTGVIFSQSAATAAPTLRHTNSSVSIQEPLTEDGSKELAGVLGKAKAQNSLAFTLTKTDNATLARVCELAPGMSVLRISNSKDLTDVSPLTKLTNLTTLELKAGAQDISALAGLTNLTDLDLEVPAADCSALAGMTKLTRLSLSAPNATNTSFMKGMTALRSVTVRGKNITDLSGLPSLPGLKSAHFLTSADLAPLAAAMPNLVELDLTASTVDDLSPLKNLSKLTKLNLYGCQLKDFSPLADIPTLRSVMYYASKGAKFADLGKLQQVTELRGGLTKLDDISFVAGMPNLKKFDVFAEYIRDYTPLSKSNIEDFQVWDMRVPVGDVAAIGQMKSLKRMKFWSAEGCTNSAALSNLGALEELVVWGWNKKGGEPFDCSAASSWKNVKKIEFKDVAVTKPGALAACAALQEIRLTNVNAKGDPFDLSGIAKVPGLQTLVISKSAVAGFEALAGCSSLSIITLDGAGGVASLAPLKNLSSLKIVNVKKGAFPDAELQGFGPNVKIRLN